MALRAAVAALERVNERIGRAIAWLTVFMVAVTFLIVILRYGFGLSWVWMQESVLWAHSIVFLGAAGYGLLRESHVRVDILYRGFGPRAKAWTDLLGTLILLFPFCAVLIYQAWPYVADSWAIREGSLDAGGIPAAFVLKTFILVFPVVLALQGLAVAGRSLLVISARDPGKAQP